ncbi:hypothetical protein KM043_004024 [Ampulex compressa]|nr:hypothetical protein KM043_004024 [Ampulex compressa]
MRDSKFRGTVDQPPTTLDRPSKVHKNVFPSNFVRAIFPTPFFEERLIERPFFKTIDRSRKTRSRKTYPNALVAIDINRRSYAFFEPRMGTRCDRARCSVSTMGLSFSIGRLDPRDGLASSLANPRRLARVDTFSAINRSKARHSSVSGLKSTEERPKEEGKVSALASGKEGGGRRKSE